MSTEKTNLIKTIVITIIDVVVSLISLFRDEKKDDKKSYNDDSNSPA